MSSAGKVPWWKYDGSRGSGIAILLVLCYGGLRRDGSALLGTRELVAADLSSPPYGRYLDVSCDSLVHAGTFTNKREGYLCVKAGRSIPVVSDEKDDLHTRQISGRMRKFATDSYNSRDDGDVNYLWWTDVIDNQSAIAGYVEIQTQTRGRVVSVFAILAGLAAIFYALRWWGAQWVVWFRRKGLSRL
jgi:hypothetical protein